MKRGNKEGRNIMNTEGRRREGRKGDCQGGRNCYVAQQFAIKNTTM